jgi:uncharacterized protein YecA (UPF0149 family)
MLEFNYTEQHKALLSTYLANRPSAMTLSQAEGYLFALICSPSATEVEQWLNEITANDTQLSEEVVFALMALHHQISEQVFSQQYALPWSEMTAYQSKQEWSIGFLQGAQPYFEYLIQAHGLSEDLKQALQMATEQLAFFSLSSEQVRSYCEQLNCDEHIFVSEQTALAKDFAPSYAQLIENVAVASGLFDEDEEGF